MFYARARTRDRDIGVVLEALDRPLRGNANGIAADTIVIFTSNHGEQFGSHTGQGDDYVYEETMRMPLAIRYPRVLGGASQNDMLVSQVDIMPTLLKWCGITVPAAVQGRDLSELIAGRAGERPDAVYAEGRLGRKDEWRMLVRGYDKLVVDMEGTVTHLFNLADDPYELTNLANVSAAAIEARFAARHPAPMDEEARRRRRRVGVAEALETPSPMREPLIAFLISCGTLRAQAAGVEWGAYTGNTQESARDFAAKLGKTPPWQMIFVNVADGFPRGFAGNLAIFLEIPVDDDAILDGSQDQT